PGRRTGRRRRGSGERTATPPRGGGAPVGGKWARPMMGGAPPPHPLRVERLLAAEGLALELIAGRSGIDRRITNPRIQKPALALTGYTAHVHPERLQVLGLTEIDYLETLDAARRAAGIEALMSSQPAAIAVMRNLEVPSELPVLADRHGVALLRTPVMS